MKLRSIYFLVVLLLPGFLFGQTKDLIKSLEKASKLKTPEGFASLSDPEHSSRANVEPSTSMEKTTRLYSGRGFSNAQASDVFAVGGMLYVSNKAYYMQSKSAAEHQKVFDGTRKILQDYGVSDQTLTAYDQYVACRMKAPWDTLLENWTEEQRGYWVDCGFAKLVFEAISDDLKPNSDAYYFYWLGIDSVRLGVHVPQGLEEGMTVDELKEEVGNGLAGFGFAQTDPVNQNVSPEVAAAVRTIADRNEKMETEVMPISELNAIADAAFKIIDAATNAKLLQ